MPQQKQAESQRDSQKPQVSPASGGGEQLAVPAISGLGLTGGNALAQASRLNDGRFSVSQRQQMAGQIAQIGGNQHMGLVMRAIKPGARPTIQPKLKVNELNDPYEREAESVADQVMQKGEVSPVQPSQIQTSRIQRIESPDPSKFDIPGSGSISTPSFPVVPVSKGIGPFKIGDLKAMITGSWSWTGNPSTDPNAALTTPISAGGTVGSGVATYDPKSDSYKSGDTFSPAAGVGVKYTDSSGNATTVSANGSMTGAGVSASHTTTGGTTVSAGFKHDAVKDTKGFEAAISQTVKDTVITEATGMVPSLKAGGEVNTKGGSLSLEGSLAGHGVTFTNKLTLLSFESGGIKFMTDTMSAKVPMQLLLGVDPSSPLFSFTGEAGKLDIKLEVTLSIDVSPNVEFIMSEAGQAAIAAITPGAIVAGGVATILGACAAISDADDLKVIPDQAYRMIQNMTDGYQAGIMGQENAGFGPMYDHGYGQGKAQRDKGLEKAPAEVFDTELKKRNVGNEARALMIPQVKQAILKQWDDEHWFDRTFGMGAGHRDLERIIGDWETDAKRTSQADEERRKQGYPS